MFALTLLLATHFSSPLSLDPSGRTVTYYPASLLISHTPRALVFYNDTKLAHLTVPLKPIDTSYLMTSPNVTTACTPAEHQFFIQLLKSTARLQRVITRLLSLPGYSGLVECDSYLRRFYLYDTGIPASFNCPRAYKRSLSDCKQWALAHCHELPPNVRVWLKPASRVRRSSWFCHSGMLGILRGFYELTGGDCHSDSTTGIKKALKSIAKALSLQQSLTRTVNGKVVYLLKTTDALNTKMSGIIGNLHSIDSVFKAWRSQISAAVSKESCRHDSVLEFLSHFVVVNNRALSSILRLNEIQEMVSQLAQLRQREMVGYSHLPRFLAQQLATILSQDPSMIISAQTLTDGFPLLVNPIVDMEHSDNHLELDILITIPELTSDKAICTVEYLSPVKYNISGTCYTGPIIADNLALITCADTKTIVRADSLAKCYQEDDSLLCPYHILRPVHDLSWLGLPWTSKTHMSFSRHHQPAQDCNHLIPMLHLGGRNYLATTTETLQLNQGTLGLSPLTVYRFPCNMSFQGMQTGLSHCPHRLEITVPLIQPGSIRYVPWTTAAHSKPFNLRYDDLHIPAPLKLNKSTLQQLDKTYHMIDGRLTNQIRQVKDDIRKIHETSATTAAEVCAYLALALAVINSTVFVVLLCRFCRQQYYYHVPILPPQGREPTVTELVVLGNAHSDSETMPTVTKKRSSSQPKRNTQRMKDFVRGKQSNASMHPGLTIIAENEADTCNHEVIALCDLQPSCSSCDRPLPQDDV